MIKTSTYVATLAILILAGMTVQFMVPINHDIGWVLYGAKQMTEGAEFGRDIIAPNPPLIWYMNSLIVYAAKLFDMSLPVAYRLICGIAALASLVVSHRLLKRTSLSRHKAFVPVIMLLMAAFLFPLAGRNFGQREYFSLIALLPFAFLLLGRLEGQGVSAPAGFLIGFFAAAGLALKPYMMVIPLLLGLYALFRKGKKVFYWAELYGFILFIFIYPLSVLIFNPAYISDVVPLVMKFYWGFNVPLSAIIIAYLSLFLFPVIWGVVMAVWRYRLSGFQVIFLCVFAGFLFSLLVQLKGYSYHAYPAVATLALLLASSLFMAKPRPGRLVFMFLFGLFMIGEIYRSAGWTLYAMDENADLQRIHREIAEEVDRLQPNGTFTAFSTHPFPGFPTALVVHARWVGRSNSHMAIPAIVKSAEMGIRPDPEMEKYARSEVLLTLRKFKPDLVLVDQRPQRHAIGNSKFNFLTYYSQDPEFRRVWSKYRKVTSVEGIDFYKIYSGDDRNND